MRNEKNENKEKSLTSNVFRFTRIFSPLLAFCMFLAPPLEGPSSFQKRGDPCHLSSQSSKISLGLQKQILQLSNPEETLKIWAYFTDKGITSQASYRKKLAEARLEFTDRCIWRRRKVRPESNLLDYSDLPVYPPYIKKLRSLVKRTRTVSRWINAVSAEVSIPQILTLEKLKFISNLTPVVSFRREEPQMSQISSSGQDKQDILDIDYGSSLQQLIQINVSPLHRLGFSGKDVIVCMLDTGFRKSHEIFRHANLIAERDFVNGDDDVQQDLQDQNDYSDSHGTGTWSILGGYKLGELIGPAYGADFILAKTETERFEQPIEEDYWVAGIEWAESLGAEVVSSSLGYTDWYTFEDLNGEKAVTTLAADRAVSLGVVVVNAAGNERNNPWGHIIAPADGKDVISVGAVDSSGIIASFSSPGPTSDGRTKPEVCAQGVDNWLAANREDGSDYYRRGSGTSFATPLVAGAVALLLEIHRDWTPALVRQALLSTASQSSSPDNDYGWGIVNAAQAVSYEFVPLKLHTYTIDDDSSGESSGNGNGQAETGETVEIGITLENITQTAVLSLEGTLTSTHPDIKIIQSRVTFPVLPPFETQLSEKPFVLQIPSFFLGHHAVFLLKISGPNTFIQFETIRISVSR